MNDAILVILSRWLHLVAACAALGGTIVMRLVLPVGLGVISDPELRKAVFLRCRRVFKMVIHTAILIFLVTGSYNAWLNWGGYHRAVPMSHAVFGLHVLLALIVFGIALWVLTGKEPPKAHASAMLVNFVLLLLVVAAGSSLKYVREHPPAARPATQPIEP
jgi:uncharacterized membrane protein